MQNALDAVAADYVGFQGVMARLLGDEIESFERLSEQLGFRPDVLGLIERMKALMTTLSAMIEAGKDGTIDPGEAAAQVVLLDSMLEQLDRFTAVARLRGAAATSGDLLTKLPQWLAVMRDWLAGIGRQLMAIAQR